MENGDVLSRLSSLDAVASELNSLSDSASLHIRALEERLAQMQLGVDVTLNHSLLTVQVEINAEEIEADWEGKHEVRVILDLLAFGRYRDGWRFLVRNFERFYLLPCARFTLGAVRATLRPGTFENEIFDVQSWGPISEKPLSDCSRDVRLAALELIPKLLDLIEKEARKRIADIKAGLAIPVGATTEASDAASSDLLSSSAPIVRKGRGKSSSK